MFRYQNLVASLMRLSVISIVFASSAQAGVTSVTVELHEVPGAVWMAAARQNGESISESALESYRNRLRASQDELLASLSSQGVAFQVGGTEVLDSAGSSVPIEFRYTLVFNGVNLRVDQDDIAAIEALPQVKKVHRDSVYRPQLDNSVDYIRAPQVYGGVEELSPFDDLREGFEGQGIHLAVIDTGIDWTHEMFGLDPSPPRLGVEPSAAATGAVKHEKVIYYLPLADIVVEDGNGHGTHVASTAAGYLGFEPGSDGLPLTEDDVPVHGVAPQARLMAYKVCSDSLSTVGGLTGAIGGCLTSVIVFAIEDSVSPRTVNGFPKPVAHVINMSLGGAGSPDSPTAIASDNASLLGTVVVAAAGNEGPGEATLGAPAAGRRVIAVAAHNDPGVFPNSIDVLQQSGSGVQPGTPKIPAVFAPDSNAGQKISQPIAERYVFGGLADTPDQVPLTAAGRICLTERGSTATAAGQGTGLFSNKAANCQAKGAIAMVVFNNEPGPIGSVLAPSGIPVFTISRQDGLVLRDSLGFDAAGISNFPIRINLEDPGLFEPGIAGFSSRGPVSGLGQVKPDVATPGVDVLAAFPPASVNGALAGGDYGSISGTSMASPHTAGAAALVKQAHPTWNPDMVRTALINTATNPRDRSGAPSADGLNNEPILAQGGGLVDVFEAVNATALMGVAGEGIAAPSILGSHSFGEVPVVNSRCLHSESVTVTIRDVSGEGGTFNLSVANNRDLHLQGIEVAVSPSVLSVPAGGDADFEVTAGIDGDLIRQTLAAKVNGSQITFEPIQMQWYVLANRSDGAETLRMPFYLRPVESVPAALQSETETFAGTILAGDLNLELVPEATFSDIPFQVSQDTVRIDALLEFDELVDDVVADLDFFLLDPDGEQIGSSASGGGPERIVASVDRAGTYTYRVTGFLNTPTDFEITSTQVVGSNAPPTLLPIEGEFLDSQGRSVDFDGDFTLNWAAGGGQTGFEVQRSTDGENWEVIAVLGAAENSHSLEDQPNGEYFFRVSAFYPGEICTFVSDPGNVESVLVDRRSRVNITNKVATAVSNVSFDGTIFQFDLGMTNEDSRTYLPLVHFNIVKISSSSGTVEVLNADNGGSGTSRQDAALFDFSQQLGADSEFSPGESTATRSLRFSDETAELFTFKAKVTAYKRTGGSAGEGSSGGSSGEDAGEGAGESDDPVDEITALLEFTVSPLTGTVIVELVQELL